MNPTRQRVRFKPTFDVVGQQVCGKKKASFFFFGPKNLFFYFSCPKQNLSKTPSFLGELKKKNICQNETFSNINRSFSICDSSEHFLFSTKQILKQLVRFVLLLVYSFRTSECVKTGVKHVFYYFVELFYSFLLFLNHFVCFPSFHQNLKKSSKQALFCPKTAYFSHP